MNERAKQFGKRVGKELDYDEEPGDEEDEDEDDDDE